MIRGLFILTALVAILIATAPRFVHQPTTSTSTPSQAHQHTSIITHAAAPIQPSPTINYYADLLNLLAPFEADDGDPFRREKWAETFQARIENLNSAETLQAYQAAQTIHAANPTEASADLLDRILQRARELNPPPDLEPAEQSAASHIIALSDSDPIAAATLAIQQLPTDRQQQNLLIGILQRWAARDSNGALSWANQFPEGDLRTRAFNQLARLAPLAPESKIAE